MISKKYEQIVFAFLMALFMSCFMSLVVSIFNVGWVNGIIAIWLKAWGFAFCVAFPTVVLVAPIARKFVSLLVEDDDKL